VQPPAQFDQAQFDQAQFGSARFDPAGSPQVLAQESAGQGIQPLTTLDDP
jgi:hypothetical protein